MNSTENPKAPRWLLVLAAVVVVAYAFVAAFRTIGDLDTGWLMATGRYIVQHHAIPSSDVLSYTAAGREWIYPPLAGVFFYGIFAAFGWKGLTWFCALACAFTVALLVARRSTWTLAVLAVGMPLLADRMSPRGDLFTVIFFTAYLLILSRERLGKNELLLLPFIMLLWVNVHPGFVLGLAMLAAFIGWQAIAVVVTHSPARRVKLRTVAPWAAASLAVTLANPWGPKIYLVLYRQQQVMKFHSAFIGEWTSVPLSWRELMQVNTLYGLALVFALIAVALAVCALWKRRLGLALIFAAAAYFMVEHLRTEALCIIAIAWAAGELAGSFEPLQRPFVLRVAAGAFIAFALFGTFQFVSQRIFVVQALTTNFGAGESWAFPEGAAAFIEREHLAGNVFHPYDLGGWFALRLGPVQRDYIDGRAIPFGTKLFIEQSMLMSQAPDAPAWQQYADHYNINLLLFSLARYGGIGSVPLASFCRSESWTPVYLDDVSIVLMRNAPENQSAIARLRVDCAQQPFAAPEGASKIAEFNYDSNAAAVLYVLGRDAEASAAIDRALALYPYDPNIRLTKAQLLAAKGQRQQAEEQYRASLASKETDTAWFAYGNLLITEGRLQEARAAMDASAEVSPHPQNAQRIAGYISIAMHEPRKALAYFDNAAKASLYRGDAEILGTEFNAQIEEGRSEAYEQLGDLRTAIEWQLKAVARTSYAQKRWVRLARLYQSAQMPQQAAEAMQRAEQLSPRH